MDVIFNHSRLCPKKVFFRASYGHLILAEILLEPEMDYEVQNVGMFSSNIIVELQALATPLLLTSVVGAKSEVQLRTKLPIIPVTIPTKSLTNDQQISELCKSGTLADFQVLVQKMSDYESYRNVQEQACRDLVSTLSNDASHFFKLVPLIFVRQEKDCSKCWHSFLPNTCL